MVIGDYFENLYSNTLENLEEIDIFLNIRDQLKLSQENIGNINRSKKAMRLKQ